METKIIKVENITANPFKDMELFDTQLENRELLISELIENNSVVKLVFNNEDYVLITPAFKAGYKYQVTYYIKSNEPISHACYETKKELIRDSYTRHELKHIEILIEYKKVGI